MVVLMELPTQCDNCGTPPAKELAELDQTRHEALICFARWLAVVTFSGTGLD